MLRERWPRILSLAIGGWLVVSTIAFRTESSPGFNRLMIGLLVMGCAAMALWAPWFRFANTAMGVWLLFSAATLRHASGFLTATTFAAAGALVVLSLIPTPARLTDPRKAFVGYRP